MGLISSALLRVGIIGLVIKMIKGDCIKYGK